MGQKFMDLFNNVTLKHFKFLRFVAENIDDDHVMCKITSIARSDRIDTPYYMVIDELFYYQGILRVIIIH